MFWTFFSLIINPLEEYAGALEGMGDVQRKNDR